MGNQQLNYLEEEIEKMINEGGLGVASHYDYNHQTKDDDLSEK